MKNILLSILLSLLSFAGYSHARGIDIRNETQCDIYVQIRGSKECGSCQLDYMSDLILIPGGGNAFYPNTTMLGGTFPMIAPVYVHSALIFSGPRHCQPLQTWLVGEPKCNYPMETFFFAQDMNCRTICDRLRAIWIPAQPTCEGLARLIFAY